jgi:hypothetical protein
MLDEKRRWTYGSGYVLYGEQAKGFQRFEASVVTFKLLKTARSQKSFWKVGDSRGSVHGDIFESRDSKVSMTSKPTSQRASAITSVREDAIVSPDIASMSLST